MATNPIVFPFEPDWSTKPIERFRWLSEVMTAYSGVEQRARLRLRPRVEIEYFFNVYDREARKLNSILFEHQSKSFTIPFWFDSTLTTSNVSAGGSNIPCVTYGHAFEVGEPAVIWSSYLVNEEVTVQTVNANSIDISGTLSNNYSAGAVMLPARYGYIASAVNLDDDSAKHREVKTIFYCDPADYSTIDVTWDTFNTYDVFSQWPERSRSITSSLKRILDVFDPELGLKTVYDRTGSPQISKTLEYQFATQEEILQFKSYILSADGKRVPFWFFEDTKDIKVTQSIGSSDTTIDIDNIGLTETGYGEFRNRICIITTDGTKYFRNVTNSAELSDDEERITIDSALGTAYTAEEIAMISFMTLGRLINDSIEISYDNINHASSSISVYGTHSFATKELATTTTTTTTSSTTSSTTSTTSTTNTQSTTSTTVTMPPITWTTYDSIDGNDAFWADACYSEDLTLFVAVAISSGHATNEDIIMISSNGTSWTGVSALNAYSLYGVCWCEYRQKFFAVGDGPYLHYSSDGSNWTTISITDKYTDDDLDFVFVRIKSQGNVGNHNLVILSKLEGPVVAVEGGDGSTLEFDYIRRTKSAPLVYNEPDGSQPMYMMWEALEYSNASFDAFLIASSAGEQRIGVAFAFGDDPLNWAHSFIVEEGSGDTGLWEDICFSAEYNRFLVCGDPGVTSFPLSYTNIENGVPVWKTSNFLNTTQYWQACCYALKWRRFMIFSRAQLNGPSNQNYLYGNYSADCDRWGGQASEWEVIESFANYARPCKAIYAPDLEIVVVVMRGTANNDGVSKVIVGS